MGFIEGFLGIYTRKIPLFALLSALRFNEHSILWCFNNKESILYRPTTGRSQCCIVFMVSVICIGIIGRGYDLLSSQPFMINRKNRACTLTIRRIADRLLWLCSIIFTFPQNSLCRKHQAQSFLHFWAYEWELWLRFDMIYYTLNTH